MTSDEKVTASKRVLIVDDELDQRIYVAALFKTSGYAPIVTKNGKEGMQKTKELRPDLIILDVMMPGEGGVQMYRQLKTDQTLKAIPVIMLSAVGQKTFSHYLNMVNVRLEKPIPRPEAYIEKPPEAEDLLQMAARLIGKREKSDG